MTRILYYRYFITQDGVRTNASIIPIINHIMKFKPKLDEREKQIEHNRKSERILLNKYETPSTADIENTIDSNSRIVTFSRKRQNHPYISDNGTDSYEKIPITRKVLELATCLIIPSQNLFLLQRNSHSVTINHIKKYLLEFFNNDKLGIELIPVAAPSNFQEIARAKNINRVDYIFNTEILNSIILQYTTQPEETAYVELLQSQSNSAEKMNSPITQLSFYNGRFRNKMNTHETFNFLQFIMNLNSKEESPLEKIKVTYKINGKRKTVDLVNDGIKSFNIEIENDNDGSEYVGNKICKEYYDGDNNRIEIPNISLKNYEINPTSDLIQIING